MKKLIPFVLALLSGFQLMAQSELKTKSVSIFKNGKSFVIKEGNVSTNNNIYTLQDVPNALFGTLWFISQQSNILQVTSKREKVDIPSERKASRFVDLMYANKGKTFTLTTQDDKTYVGVVEDFNPNENVEELVLLIKTDNKWISIQPSSIKTVEFADKPDNIMKLTTKTEKPSINVKFAKGGNQSLNIMYLQNGLSWIPTYLLELQSDTKADLRLQAEVINHVEDLVNVNIDFVVGVPNFKFANEKATLTSFIEQKYRDSDIAGYMSNSFSNSYVAQMSSNSYSEQMIDEEDVLSNVNASEDLYFYNINNVSLEKDMRAHYPLFSSPISIKHLYECDLSPMQDERNYRDYDDESQFTFGIKRCNVFHTIEIKNNTNTPFTTGAVMIVDGKTKRPLAEDLIKYTGVGQTSSIQLTQSPDIRVEEQEKIVSIQKKEKILNGYTYDLLTIESEVVIINTKKQDIEMLVSKLISGKSKTATIQYESKQMPPTGNSGNINQQDKLSFSLNIKGRETKKFSYTYEMYTR